MTETTWMSTDEVAGILGLRMNYIYMLLREGKLRGRKMTDGGRVVWQVDKASVDNWRKMQSRRKLGMGGQR